MRSADLDEDAAFLSERAMTHGDTVADDAYRRETRTGDHRAFRPGRERLHAHLHEGRIAPDLRHARRGGQGSRRTRLRKTKARNENARNQKPPCHRRGPRDPAAASTSSSARARSTRSWGRTAPASRRSPMCSPAATATTVTGGSIRFKGEDLLEMEAGRARGRRRLPRLPVPGRDSRRCDDDVPEDRAQRAAQGARPRRNVDAGLHRR